MVLETNSTDNVRVLEYTNKIPELMSVSDLVITKPGGLTTTESLASGLPIIVINPIPGQEEENAEFLEKQGVAKWIKKHDNIEVELYNILTSTEKLQSMKINARLLAKNNSTRDIANLLNISEKTVRNHISNVMQKLGVKGRASAVVELLKLKEISF